MIPQKLRQIMAENLALVALPGGPELPGKVVLEPEGLGRAGAPGALRGEPPGKVGLQGAGALPEATKAAPAVTLVWAAMPERAEATQAPVAAMRARLAMRAPAVMRGTAEPAAMQVRAVLDSPARQVTLVRLARLALRGTAVLRARAALRARGE